MRLAARSTVIAGALAIAAIAAPAASARFDVEPQQRLNVNPPTGYATPHGQATCPRPEVHANCDQQTPQTSAVATPPTLRRARASELATINRAQARQAGAFSYSHPATARYSSADTNAYASAVHPAPAPTVGTPSDGFDYADAAIGAGIAAAVALLITAGTIAVRQRSQPRHP